MKDKFVLKVLCLLSVILMLMGSIAMAEELTGNLVCWSNWNPASTTIRSNADKNALIKEEFIKLLGGTVTAEDFIATMQK